MKMNRNRILLLAAAAMATVVLGACDSDDEQIECGEGTELEGATCVSTGESVTCGEGTELESGVCVAEGDEVSTVCGEGTELNGGECVPDDDICSTGTVQEGTACVVAPETCGDGTSYDETEEKCVADSEVTCGGGTVLDSESGECVPDGTAGSSCGTGTQLEGGVCVPDIDGCGTGTVADDGECVVADTACATGTSFDQGTNTCVPDATITCGSGTTEESGTCVLDPSGCGSNATYDEDSGTCVGGSDTSADCGTGTAYDPGREQCVPGYAITGSCDGDPTELDQFVSEDTVLSAGCYTAPNGLTLNASLTASPGVSVFVGAGEEIKVNGNGRLNATCTESSPCVFSGMTEERGSWIGIVSSSNTVEGNALDWVTLRHAGQTVGSVTVNNNYNFGPIRNTTISDGLGYAISGGFVSVIEDVTVTNHEAGSISIYQRHLDTIGDGIDIQPEAGFVAYFDIRGDTHRVPMILTPKQHPWRWIDTGQKSFYAGLTIEPGTEIVFVEESGWTITTDDDAFISVNGTSEAPVILRGEAAGRGTWRGLTVSSSDTSNSLSHVQISDAAGTDTDACLTVKGYLELTDALITTCDGLGLLLQTEPENVPVIERNTITDSVQPLEWSWRSALPATLSVDNELIGNDDDSIRIGATCPQRVGCPVELTTIPAFDLPLLVRDDSNGYDYNTFAIGNRTYIEGGLYVFDDLTMLRVDAANFGLGSDDDALQLEGSFEVPGAWGGVLISDASGVANTLTNVEIRHAGAFEVDETGYEGFYSLIIDDDSRIGEIDGLLIEDGFGDPVYVGEDVVITSCTGVDLSDFDTSWAVGPGAEAFNDACGIVLP